MELIFYDFETTGLDVKYDKLTEIGAVSSSGKKFNILIKIEEKLPKKIVELTGITDQLLADKGVSLKLALEKFYDYLKSFNTPVTLIAHNGEKFDDLFIKYACKSVDIDHVLLYDRQVKYFDTYIMAKLLYPRLKSYSLKNLCKSFNIENLNHHRALNDAIVCKELYSYMFHESNVQSFAELYNLIMF